MIDNRTSNKNYPLPHPENIASQDVERIADTISMVDVDVTACDSVIESLNETVSALEARSLRIPQSLVGIVDTELQDLEPNRYIVVNADASGFSTVEGGGGEGGLRGEILAKRSNINFDTMWVDPKSLYKRAITIAESSEDYTAKNNNTVILADEIEIDNSGELPRFELTQRQISADTTADSQYSYIFTDIVEAHGDDESDIASKTNFGRVKVGDGIALDNGIICVTEYPKCSKTTHGAVKIGDGINVEDGVISAKEYPLADSSNFGLVKLSSDFEIASEGELILAGKKDVEEIIYQAANISVVSNNCITPTSDYALYRLFVSEDSLITFDWSQIIQEKDIVFDLEIISDGSYVIAFDADISWTLPCAGVSAGKTIIRFEKKLGSQKLFGNMISCEYRTVADLMINDTDDIQKDLICGTNGCVDNLSYIFTVRSSTWHDGGYTGNTADLVVLYVDFVRSTLVDYVNLYPGFYSGGTAQFFIIEGSIDRKNWAILYQAETGAQVLDKGLILTKRGYFRHYRLRFSKNFTLRGFKFFGFSVDDNLYEYEKIVPQLTANSLNGYVLTSSGTNDGALFNLTDNSVSNYANFSVRDGDGKYWIKYELPEAKIVDMIDIASHKDAANRFPLWFKIEASNDDTNWTLLLERSELTYWNGGTTKQYFLQNTVAYKYYRFTPIELVTSEFRLARLRLYHRVEGQTGSANFIPTLSGPSQGGYVVSCSSEASGHAAYYAFDGNDATQWATVAGQAQNSWIQIKFPTATLCNTATMKARGDSWYVQSPTFFIMQGSNDGIFYDDLKNISTTWTQGEEKTFSFFNEIPYLYYRIFINTVQDNGNHAALSVLNFSSSLRDYKKELNAYRILTPIMTANSQDGFILTANSIYTGQKVYNPFEAFNRTISGSSSWTTKAQSGWIQVELPAPDVANILKMSGGFSNEEPDSFVLYGSNDGENYVELLNGGSLTWTHNETKTWNLDNETAYKIYKITAENKKSAYITISEIQLINHTVTREY